MHTSCCMPSKPPKQLLPGRIVHVLDDSWWKSVQAQGVINSDGDTTWHSCIHPDHIANIHFEGKMTALMLHHLDPIHPLGTWNEFNNNKKKKSYLNIFRVRTYKITLQAPFYFLRTWKTNWNWLFWFAHTARLLEWKI